MPSKEFLALLLKIKAAETSVVDVEGGVEAGPECNTPKSKVGYSGCYAHLLFTKI